MKRQYPVDLLSFAGLACFGGLWGMTIPLTKVAVSTGHQPIGLIFWQLLFSALILGAIAAVRRQRLRFGRRHLPYFLVIGLLGTLIPNSFSYLAAAQLPAGIMAIAIATVPMFALLIALALGNERFSPLRVLGIVLGVTAMVLLAVPEASLPEPEKAHWVLVALRAPLCYGIEGNYIAHRAPVDLDPMSALLGASVCGALIAAPIAWFGGYFVDLSAPWGKAEWALLGSATGHAFAYAGYMWLVGFAGVVFSSQIAYVVTMAALAISMLFLGESYSAFVWLAIGMMLAGLLLVQPAGKLPDTPDATKHRAP